MGPNSYKMEPITQYPFQSAEHYVRGHLLNCIPLNFPGVGPANTSQRHANQGKTTCIWAQIAPSLAQHSLTKPPWNIIVPKKPKICHGSD